MPVIEGRAIGARKPLFAEWSIPFPPDLPDGGGPITLRELIACVVRAEIAAFRERQEERRLPRVLAPGDIATAAARGKIDPGAHQPSRPVDDDAALATALQAFEDGFYLVVLDGVEQRRLDGEVFLRTDSRVAFVRLVPLAGA